MTRHSAMNSKKGLSEKIGQSGVYKNLEIQFNKVYKKAVQDSKGLVSIKTHHRYRDSMKKFLGFCAEKFRLEKFTKIAEKHVLAYIEYRRQEGIAEKTIKDDITALRFFHRHIEGRKNVLPDNKSIGLKSTPDGRKDRAWRENEYEKMIRIARNLNRKDVEMALRLGRHAGLRIHEVTRLDVKQAEQAIEKGWLHVKGKGGKERDIPLSQEAREALQEACKLSYDKQNKLLVPENEKTHLVIKRIQGFVKRHRDKVFVNDGRTVKITFHGLRHLYARTEYYSRERVKPFKGKKYSFDKKALREVSELLGHGRKDVTRIYLGR